MSYLYKIIYNIDIKEKINGFTEEARPDFKTS